MARARTSYAGPRSTFMPGLLLMVVMLLLSVVGMASCSEAHSNMLLTADQQQVIQRGRFVPWLKEEGW